MTKKLSDEECRENYNRLRSLFDEVIGDSARFEMVYANGTEVGLTNAVIVRVTTYTYASYAVGFDTAANEIIILPVVPDLTDHGEPIYLKHSEIKKAKQSFFTKTITVYDKRLPKTYIELDVVPLLNEDPDDVILLTEQEKEYERFMAFFKTQYKK